MCEMCLFTDATVVIVVIGGARYFFWGGEGVENEAPTAPTRKWRRRSRRGERCREGVSLSPPGEGYGERAVPPPQKMF